MLRSDSYLSNNETELAIKELQKETVQRLKELCEIFSTLIKTMEEANNVNTLGFTALFENINRKREITQNPLSV